MALSSAMLQALAVGDDGAAHPLEGLDALREALASGQRLWVDLDTYEDAAEAEEVLSRVFRFHPLTVEDALTAETNPPKLDEHDDYIFIVFHALGDYETFGQVSTREVCLYLGRSYVVSCHHGPLPALDGIRQRCLEDGLPLRRGPDWLLHAILDRLVDDYLPCIDAMEEALDRLEAEALAGQRAGLLERVLRLRGNALHLRRLTVPQRELLARLSRPEFPQLVRPEANIYFRDIYDHLVRTEYLIEALRDLTDSALNTYLTVVSNRLNEVMKVLTAVATIFLPLTLLSGIYGMNFAHRVWPPFESGWGFPTVVGAMAALGLGIALFFRHRGWL
jgi:magnesium transporter